MAAANRQFMHRVTRHLVITEGIRQFLDTGTGFPSHPNLHEIAQQHAEQPRVVYVDNDPLVAAHVRALMVSNRQCRTEFITADLRNPAEILTHPTLTSTLDLNRPIGLTLIAILMLVAYADDPWDKVAQLRDAMPTGSCLALTHPTADFNPADTDAAVAMTSAGMTLIPVIAVEAALRAFTNSPTPVPETSPVPV